MRAKGVSFATLTHAAGISSTGDAELDLRLPFDEPYRIPEATAAAIGRTRADGGRIVAVGTTVVRALEHAGRRGLIRSGEDLATQRIGPGTQLRIVDVILSGTHKPGSNHYELFRAFADDATLRQVVIELDSYGYRTHEFGDSVFIERTARAPKEGRHRPAVSRLWRGRPSPQQSLPLHEAGHAICSIGVPGLPCTSTRSTEALPRRTAPASGK